MQASPAGPRKNFPNLDGNFAEHSDTALAGVSPAERILRGRCSKS
jgi:hypothetical protein